MREKLLIVKGMVIGVDNGRSLCQQMCGEGRPQGLVQNHHVKVTLQTKQSVAYHFETNTDEEEGWIVVDNGGGPARFVDVCNLNKKDIPLATSEGDDQTLEGPALW